MGRMATMPREHFERTLEVNLLGTWRTDRAVLDEIVRNRGYLLNIASLSAASHTPLMGAYTASKAGVEAMTDCLRVELAPHRRARRLRVLRLHRHRPRQGELRAPVDAGLTSTLPKFIAQPAPLPLAIDAIERGVARRSARIWAPRYVGGALALRGILQPLTEWQLRAQQGAARSRCASPIPTRDRPDEQDPRMGVSAQPARRASSPKHDLTGARAGDPLPSPRLRPRRPATPDEELIGAQEAAVAHEITDATRVERMAAELDDGLLASCATCTARSRSSARRARRPARPSYELAPRGRTPARRGRLRGHHRRRARRDGGRQPRRARGRRAVDRAEHRPALRVRPRQAVGRPLAGLPLLLHAARSCSCATPTRSSSCPAASARSTSSSRRCASSRPRRSAHFPIVLVGTAYWSGLVDWLRDTRRRRGHDLARRPRPPARHRRPRPRRRDRRCGAAAEQGV